MNERYPRMIWFRKNGAEGTVRGAGVASADSSAAAAAAEAAAASDLPPAERVASRTPAPSPEPKATTGGRTTTPSQKLTPLQMCYIFCVHGGGSFIISGAINFGIAVGMYTTQGDLTNARIRLFSLPNTLAGDAAVTIIVQCLITWFIETMLVGADLRDGRINPIGFVDPPPVCRRNRALRWLLSLPPPSADDAIELPVVQPSPAPPSREPPEPLTKLDLFTANVARGLLAGFFFFCVLWGPSVGLVTLHGVPCGGDICYPNKWTPEIFKLLLGAVLGFLASSLFSLVALIRGGWVHTTGGGLAPTRVLW